MLKHIVMWKLKEFAEGKTKAENALIKVSNYCKKIRESRAFVDFTE